MPKSRSQNPPGSWVQKDPPLLAGSKRHLLSTASTAYCRYSWEELVHCVYLSPWGGSRLRALSTRIPWGISVKSRSHIQKHTSFECTQMTVMHNIPVIPCVCAFCPSFINIHNNYWKHDIHIDFKVDGTKRILGWLCDYSWSQTTKCHALARSGTIFIRLYRLPKCV